MRSREVWVHAHDLNGAGFEAVPLRLLELFLDDTAGYFAGREDCPALRLTATDIDRSYLIGPLVADPEPYRASAGELFALLSGRAVQPAFELPPWL